MEVIWIEWMAALADVTPLTEQGIEAACALPGLIALLPQFGYPIGIVLGALFELFTFLLRLS